MTGKEYRSVFDAISCSRELQERMEQKLSGQNASECVCGVRVVQQKNRLCQCLGIAACLAVILLGSAAAALNGKAPTTPFSNTTSEQTSEISTEESSETRITEQPTSESAPLLYPGKDIPIYDDFPMQELSQLSDEQLIQIGKKYYDAAFRLLHPDSAPPYLFFYPKTDEHSSDENHIQYCPVGIDSVKTIADVRNDFYSVFTSDWDSSILDECFAEMDGRLYYCTNNPYVSIYPSDYVLELDTVTENEIYYSYRMVHENVTEEDRFKNVALPFTLKRTEEGWKVSVFISPFDVHTFN